MTGAEFKAALGKLGLPLGGKLTCRLLGLSERQLRYVATGRCPLARPAANMLGILLLFHRAGVPPAAVDALLRGRDVAIGGKFPRGTKKSMPFAPKSELDWLKRFTPPGRF